MNTSFLFSIRLVDNLPMSNAPPNPPEHDPAKAAESLPGEHFQFVLAAFRVNKEGRFAVKDVSQMLGLYWRDLNDLVVRVGWEGLIKAEGEGWYSFTPFGLDVAKHVRKLHAKRHGLADPDAKPSILRRIGSTLFATTGKIVVSVITAVLTMVAIAGLILWLKNKGIDIRGVGK